MAVEVIWGTKDFQVPEYFNFADVIDEWAQKEKKGERESDIPALWWVSGEGQEEKWSFQDLASNSKRVANVLYRSASIKPSDRVIVLVYRVPEYWLMQLACLRTGGVLVPVPPDIGPQELQRRISACKPSCVVAGGGAIDEDLLDVIDQFSSSADSTVKARLMVNRMKPTNREGWLSYEELFQEASNEHESVKSLSSSPVAFFFTSGTTGNSKMIEHSQGSMCLASVGMPRVGPDLFWCNTSTGWSAVLGVAFLSWYFGNGVFAHYSHLKARETLETLQNYPITTIGFLPGMYKRCVQEDLKGFRLPKLRHCFTGGEPMDKQAIIKWKEGTGIDLLQGYGTTETGSLTLTLPFHENRVGSVGKAFPGMQVAIIDDNNQEVPPGNTGRVALRVKPYRPVGLFTCYVGEPQKTAACFSGDFFVTDDLGFKDEDDYIWLQGRIDDIIFCEGDNINPYEVEDCLKEHPAVLECAVVSSPDPFGQSTVKAFVVLSDEFKEAQQNETVKVLQDHVTRCSAAWMCPTKIEFVPFLPKTLIGKTNRKELREKEWKTTK